MRPNERCRAQLKSRNRWTGPPGRFRMTDEARTLAGCDQTLTLNFFCFFSPSSHCSKFRHRLLERGAGIAHPGEQQSPATAPRQRGRQPILLSAQQAATQLQHRQSGRPGLLLGLQPRPQRTRKPQPQQQLGPAPRWRPSTREPPAQWPDAVVVWRWS